MLFRSSPDNHLQIDITTRQLTLYQGQEILAVYPVAIGKASTPTPLGKWQVINKKILRESSIFGSRWIGLNAPSYGIHGTNNPSSIGCAASLGCIRMHNRDVEALFPQIIVGTPVHIIQQAPTASSKNIYIVRPGDTLWQIAQMHHVSLDSLLNANPTITPCKLFAGQTLILP